MTEMTLYSEASTVVRTGQGDSNSFGVKVVARQRSVLGPILFLIYINDLDDDITSKVLKFADDTKVFRTIKSDADRQHLQDDLNKLIEWSEKWQMLFNFGKCKCLHTVHGNEDAQYTMGTKYYLKGKGLRVNY